MVNTRRTADERRADLVEAAMRAFARSGLHGTAVSTITDDVGITQPYAFSLFRSKKGLFIAAVELSLDRIEQGCRDAAEQVPKRERFKAIQHAAGDLLASDPTVLMFLMQSFAAAGDEEIADVVRRRIVQLMELVMELAGVNIDKAREFMSRGLMCALGATLQLDTLLPADVSGNCPTGKRAR